MSEEQMSAGIAAAESTPSPSIKGSVFLMGVQGVKRLMSEGRLSREEVEFDLQSNDIRYLGDKILAGAWYPVTTFVRLVSIAVDAFSDGDLAYLAEQGEASAERVLGTQAYQDFVAAASNRRDAAGPGASVLTITQLLLNFGRWELDAGSNARHFEIRVTNVGDLPESLRYAGQGFIQHLASIVAGEPLRVSSERLDQDTILYRGPASQ